MLNKIAKPPWASAIEEGLKSGDITNLSPDIQKMISNDNIVYESGPPPEEPQARAYVTTEDADDNGNNDTVHMVVTNIQADIPEIHNLHSFDKGSPEYQSILSSITQVLEHENAHLKGGDESAAEAAERSFNPQFRAATNINVDHSKIATSFLNLDGDIKMKKELIALANRLDSMGHPDLADSIDSVIKSAQESYDPYGPYRTGPDESLSDPHGLGEIGKMTLNDAYTEYNGIDPDSTRGGYLITSSPDMIFMPRTAGGFFELESRRYDPLNSVWEDLTNMASETEEGSFSFASQFVKTVSREAGIQSGAPSVEEAPAEEESEPMARQKEEPVLTPTRRSGNQDIADIQTLVGAHPDGVWGPNTRAKVKDFLTERDEYILGGTPDDVLASGQGNFGVRGGKANPGEYAQNWGGMLEFLRDLDRQQESLMASLEESLSDEQDSVARQEQNVTEIDFEERDPEEGVLAGPRTVNPADDMEVEASSSEEKITKIASTLDGMFTPRINGLVRR
jgi:hypothetical protein